MSTHRYAVGQHVSYAENCAPDQLWKGGYEIVSLRAMGDREPQYQIRNADQSYERVVYEHELREDVGAGTMRAAEEY